MSKSSSDLAAPRAGRQADNQAGGSAVVVTWYHTAAAQAVSIQELPAVVHTYDASYDAGVLARLAFFDPHPILSRLTGWSSGWLRC